MTDMKKYEQLIENMRKCGATYQEILIAENALDSLRGFTRRETTSKFILENIYDKYCNCKESPITRSKGPLFQFLTEGSLQNTTKSHRQEILEEAIKCVCGQREQDYGSPESNFQTIADFWNTYLGCTHITATDVSMMMALLKIARIKNGGGTGDSFVDLAGYAACGGELNGKK